MNDQQPGEDRPDMHALTGAYAVDALDDIERARFEAHLEHCGDCRAEVAELRETSVLLGIDELAPPPALRDAVLSGIDSVRPLPPLTTTSAAAPPVPLDRARSARTRRLFGARTLLVAASVILIAAVSGLVVAQPWADEEVVAPTATERVLTADDAHRVQQEFPDGSVATVVVSRDEGRAVILTEDMANAPTGQVYELWLQTPRGDMIPAGLMPDQPDATVLLEGDASEATAVGITVEPDGGSDTPSSAPIAVFELEA